MASGEWFSFSKYPEGCAVYGPVSHALWVSDSIPWITEHKDEILLVSDSYLERAAWTLLGAKAVDYREAFCQELGKNYLWLVNPEDVWLTRKRVQHWKTKATWIQSDTAPLSRVAQQVLGPQAPHPDAHLLNRLVKEISCINETSPDVLVIVAKHSHKKHMTAQGLKVCSLLDLAVKPVSYTRHRFACVRQSDWEGPHFRALVKAWNLA
ncbi:hypothetical protein [Largemouth bass virus]|uniref:Uncharacterized protein n=1 Tax=Largemouth bass virus TaxID=176656 RepID=A0A9E7PRU3_9VIRU|nr:hypothetical protein [Mandarin fish ranavirus]UUY86239.1 hypothetical protein [Largemouth bass virus]WEI28984.1 hypothetical protein [Largemouth bass virus]WHA35551.1 hypothetical protein MSRaV_63L [Micropterus salmoides ranavirus]WHA35656.1 hypothetical protein SCRaV_63L [Siniperca chuatsi ranavirus]